MRLYDYSEWYVIGYEECRRGYLHLANTPHLNHLVPEYFAQIDEIPDWNWERKIPYPPNHWHQAGVNQAVNVWHGCFSRLQVPYWEQLTEPWPLGKPELCLWCGKACYESYSDVLVDIFACNEDCARKYRQAVLDIPAIHHLASEYRYNPLPVDPLKLRRYIEGLPSYLCPEEVSHKPVLITRPIVKRVEISTGNLQDIDGLTLED